VYAEELEAELAVVGMKNTGGRIHEIAHTICGST
jgi:hypothetical protein